MASAVVLSTPHPVITQVFNQNRDLDSTGQDSADDKFWWINEGDMKIQDKLGHVQADKFRALALYEIKDNQNYIAQMYFKYNKYDGSGGTDSIGFLYNYHDGENKYSTGIRADGYSEIKEKNDGEYSDNHNPKRIYGASGNDGGGNNNEIPSDKWIGLRINVIQDTGHSNLKIYVNNGNGWEYVTEWTDDEDMMNGGLVGIRTDGYDVEFRDFEVIDVGGSI
ncbi:MAG: hypothetical protein WAL42_01440 [Nitrososphaeraceae archaeon]